MKKNLINIVYLASGVIVNINQTIKINKKSFSGININGYNISVPKECKRDNFNNNEMYESVLLCKTQFKNIIDKIREDNVKIISLIGNNGIINEKEFTTLQ